MFSFTFRSRPLSLSSPVIPIAHVLTIKKGGELFEWKLENFFIRDCELDEEEKKIFADFHFDIFQINCVSFVALKWRPKLWLSNVQKKFARKVLRKVKKSSIFFLHPSLGHMKF